MRLLLDTHVFLWWRADDRRLGTAARAAIADADVVFVHDKVAEAKFVEEGFGIDRREVMYNDFVVVGPKDDPAGVKGKDVIEALKKLAASKAEFVSRGDKSGTHAAELRYWKAAGIDAPAAKAAGFDNWLSRLHFMKDWTRNPAVPVLGPWRTVEPINKSTWVMERNPYYWAVDTEGNQLPYIDKAVLTLAENLEVLNLRAIAGEYDMQERHVDAGKIPVILENQQRGNYKLYLDPGDYGADCYIRFNLSYEADPEIAKWLTNADFRRALSLGVERDQLNETFWLGLGTPGSLVPIETKSSAFASASWMRSIW